MKRLALFLSLLLLSLPAVADVGFRPPDGAPVYWAWPGGRAAGMGTFTNTGNAFPNSPEAFAARYGVPPMLPDSSNVRANFTVDAEAVLGVMCTTLSRASEDPSNPWGLHRGVATPLECHDWAATMEARGWLGSTLRRLYAPDSLPTPTRPTPPAPVPPPPPVPPTPATPDCPPTAVCSDPPPCPSCPLCEPARLRVPVPIASALAGLSGWNRVNAEGKDALHWLEIWAEWSGVPVPADIAATLKDASQWAIVPPGGGRQARLKRLAAWTESLQ